MPTTLPPELTLDEAKAAYRAAIDPGARDSEDAAWWTAVRDEVQAVVAAKDVREAASVICWWHHDWRMVGDTAKGAARRIRSAVSEQLKRRRALVARRPLA